jgi:hypothetical protein
MIIKLDRLNHLCGKDKAKKRQFLLQFLELVPPTLEQIKAGLKNGDRQKVRKGIHFLAPQLSFFGISDFTLILGQLDAQPRVPLEKLKGTIEQSLLKINKAVGEVRQMI